jgi:hypothetical protein
MSIDGKQRGAVADPAGGGGDLGVNSIGDPGASSRGGDPATGDWVRGGGNRD